MIELKYIITNGYVSLETMNEMSNGGWVFVTTVPASTIHPYAMPTDKATIFSKYIYYDIEHESTVRGD